MQKWKISDIQKTLDKKIKKNGLSLGIDVASKVTGWALVKTSDKNIGIIEKGIIDTKNIKDLSKRLDILALELERINITKKGSICIIEMPYVGFSAHTALILGISAGVAYRTLTSNASVLRFLTASQARKMVGIHPANCKKEIAQQFIKDKFKIDEKEDIVDGFILALAGLIEV